MFSDFFPAEFIVRLVCAYAYVCVCICAHVSVILQKIGPLPLAVQHQLLSELLQLLVAVHQERRVIPADCLGAAEETGVNVKYRRQGKEWTEVKN